MWKAWMVFLLCVGTAEAGDVQRSIYNRYSGRPDFITNLSGIVAGDLPGLTTNFAFGGGGVSDNLGSHIATTTIQGNVQAIQGSSQVIVGATTGYGSISISSLAAPDSWSFLNASTGGPVYLYDAESTSFTVRVQTTSLLSKCLTVGTTIQGDANDSLFLRTGDLLRNVVSVNSIGTRKYLFTHNATATTMVLKNTTMEAAWGITSAPTSWYGSLDNNPVQIRINGGSVLSFDISGNAAMGLSALPNAKLSIGDPSSGNVGNGSKFQVHAGSISTSGANSGYALNGRNVFASSLTWSAAQTFSSVTVSGDFKISNGSATVSGGVSASSYTINGKSLILSTYSATFCDGCQIYFASGTIGAATSLTVTLDGVSTFLIPVCTEYEGVNTAVTSVRLKTIAADRSSFVVFNADALNEKKYVCVVAGK